MYAGRIVESSAVRKLYRTPQHPYTRALLASVPRPDPDIPMGDIISGEVASPIDPPTGCRFHPRCPNYQDSAVCRDQEPDWREVSSGHFAGCHKIAPAVLTITR